MSDISINQRILEEVNTIEDENIREFIKEALAFERSKIDKRQPHFKNEYNHLIEEYVDSNTAEPDAESTSGDE